jgi:TBC1 domain family member 13
VITQSDPQGIEPSFYSLRWITTLLSREFDVLDTIRLWDSLLADVDRDQFLCYICTTMVLEQKEALMLGDFGENLSLVSMREFLRPLANR